VRQKQPALVITFRATTHAMAAEQLCTEQNLPGRLIPVPREITAGCGLAWKAKPEDADILTAAFALARLQWEAVHTLML
jgi:hypothetical protein